MKEIKLTRGYVALVDDEDYDWLMEYPWHIHIDKKSNKRTYGLYAISGRGSKRMHRLIMNTPAGMDVDHIDHNPLNNQKYNLRNCLRWQNRMNTSPWGSSKYLGVNIYEKDGHDYIRAKITVRGKCIFLGQYKTEEEAAHVYDKAAKQYFGEFANLNFKEDV